MGPTPGGGTSSSTATAPASPNTAAKDQRSSRAPRLSRAWPASLAMRERAIAATHEVDGGDDGQHRDQQDHGDRGGEPVVVGLDRPLVHVLRHQHELAAAYHCLRY